jgi:hypothetical protein
VGLVVGCSVRGNMRNVTGKPQLLGTITFIPSYWLLMDLVWAVWKTVPSVMNISSLNRTKINIVKLTYVGS